MRVTKGVRETRVKKVKEGISKGVKRGKGRLEESDGVEVK